MWTDYPSVIYLNLYPRLIRGAEASASLARSTRHVTSELARVIPSALTAFARARFRETLCPLGHGSSGADPAEPRAGARRPHRRQPFRPLPEAHWRHGGSPSSPTSPQLVPSGGQASTASSTARCTSTSRWRAL